MSEQRWTVLKEWGRGGWIVVHPGDIRREGDGRPECWAVHSQHDTWAEAMQEADRMARTITVTLPRAIGTIKEISKNTYISERAPTSPYGADILATNPQGTVGISITRDELEPLALALLAHARKETHDR